MEQNVSQQEALDMLTKMDVGFGEQNLIFYAQEGDLNKVKLLLIAGVNPNKFWRNDKQKKNIYALHNTSGFGNPEMVKLLLENGADVNLADEKGETAIIYAIQNGKVETTKILIEKGANVNHRTKDNINPLYIAVKKKNAEITEILKKTGAQEMTVQEIKSFERTQGAVKIITAIIIIGIVWFFVHIGSKGSSSSSSSSGSSSTSSGQHNCGYCNASFSGNGWATIGGEQYQPTSWLGYGYCSKKCAYDSQPNKWKR